MLVVYLWDTDRSLTIRVSRAVVSMEYFYNIYSGSNPKSYTSFFFTFTVKPDSATRCQGYKGHSIGLKVEYVKEH